MESKLKQLIASNEVMVFSKSYCPYCLDAKKTLQSKGVAMKVIELDQDKEGSQIQDTLRSMTGQSTVPNIFIKGIHIGGCDDLHAKLRNGQLKL